MREKLQLSAAGAPAFILGSLTLLEVKPKVEKNKNRAGVAALLASRCFLYLSTTLMLRALKRLAAHKRADVQQVDQGAFIATLVYILARDTVSNISSRANVANTVLAACCWLPEQPEPQVSERDANGLQMTLSEPSRVRSFVGEFCVIRIKL